MTKVGHEPQAALPAHERVAATRRAAETELVSLRRSAEGRRSALLLRDLVDPGERISLATEWRARALTGYDRDTDTAYRRNIQRFATTTTALLKDVAALPDWIAPEPPQVREAMHAAGLLARISRAFEHAAAGVRATIVPSVGLLGLPLRATQDAPGMKSLQMPQVVRVTGRNATQRRPDR